MTKTKKEARPNRAVRVDTLPLDAEKLSALLAFGITHTEVEQLLDAMSTAIATRHIVTHGGTPGQTRDLALRAAELAAELGAIVRDAPFEAERHFGGAAQKAFGSGEIAADLGKLLVQFAANLRRRVHVHLPEGKQDRPKPWKELVAVIVVVVGHRLGEVSSTARAAPFFRACELVFDIAGHPQSPRRSIEAYLIDARTQGVEKSHPYVRGQGAEGS